MVETSGARFRYSGVSSFSIFVILFAVAGYLFAGAPTAKPEDVGLSSERLQRIQTMIQRHIDSQEIPGAVTLVARRGHVAHFEAQGVMDLDSKKPMAKNSIFRLASMTKPVTAVAIMMLQEEGKVRLSDPVSKFIPEFKNMKVAVQKESAPPQPASEQDFYVVPATHDVTIQELLTHTSGVPGYTGTTPRRAERLIIQDSRPSEPLARFIPRLGSLPLDFQPGTRWKYSGLTAFEILGRVVEVASGKPFDRYLKEGLFDPLEMKDTFFSLPKDREPRLVVLYRTAPGGIERFPNPNWLSSEVFFDGGGGLMGTAGDYLQFAQMLLNGGALNGKRVLSPKTIEWMASNQVGDLYGGNHGSSVHIPGMGFGLGGEVVVDNVRAGIHRTNGSYGWNGAFGTHFWVDFKEKLVGVLMIQVSGSTQVWQIQDDYDNAVWQAIVD